MNTEINYIQNDIHKYERDNIQNKRVGAELDTTEKTLNNDNNMLLQNIKFNLGDKVIVRESIKDPDFNISMAKWTGIISDISHGIKEIQEGNLYLVTWDENTLNNFSDDIIEKCEKKNLDLYNIWLAEKDLKFLSKDKNVKNKNNYLKIKNKQLFADGDNILPKVFAKNNLCYMNEYSEYSLKLFFEYLNSNLSFPFNAIRIIHGYNGEIKTAKVKIVGLCKVEVVAGTLCEIMCKINSSKISVYVSLMDIDIEKKSRNYFKLLAYKNWLSKVKNKI